MSVQVMGGKSKEKFAVYEEKRELIRTEDAMVEVTVKVKKRRDKSRSRGQHKGQLNRIYETEAFVHKTGSWGDLLLRKKKLADSQTSINLNNAILGDQDPCVTKTCATNGQNKPIMLKPYTSPPLPSSHPAPPPPPSTRIIKIPVTDNIHVQAEVRGIESKSSHRKKLRHVKGSSSRNNHPSHGRVSSNNYRCSSNNDNRHCCSHHGDIGKQQHGSSHHHGGYHHHPQQHQPQPRDCKTQESGSYPTNSGHRPSSKCCDACTCFRNNDNNGVKDQDSQTSLPIIPFNNNNNNKVVGDDTTVKVQTFGKSPPTKDQERDQQARFHGKQVISQGTATTTTSTSTCTKEIERKERVIFLKPKTSHSAPTNSSSTRNSINNNDNNGVKPSSYQYNPPRQQQANGRKVESDISNNASSNNSNNNNNNDKHGISVPIRKMEDAQVQTVQRSLPVEKSSSTSKFTIATNTTMTTEDQLDAKSLEALQRDLKKLSGLEMENNLLRKDTAALLQQVDKAKTERQEYITTIKELYELAEVLRHENVILIGTHEEHRSLQEKLLEALGENQSLKQHLQQLASAHNRKSNQTKENDDHKQEDLWKVRDVLKEVKTAIAQEIQGLRSANIRRSPTIVDNQSSVLELFSMTNLEGSGLNDTNMQCDDEIKRILHDNNNNNAERSDVRSSTQYLEMEMPDIERQREGRRFITPTPESDSSGFSPRFSTPAQSEGEED